MTTFYLDTETFNECPIKHGTYKYVETVELMIVSWAVDDAPVSVWDATLHPKMPAEIVDNLYDERILKVAFNVPFDRGVLEHATGITIPIEQWHDVAVQARMHALAGGLAKLCEIYQVPEWFTKQATGKQLIQLFCKPRPKNCKERRATRHTHPKQWADFVKYAGNDVESMRYLHKRIPTWNYPDNPFEHELWALDDKINGRGFAVDIPLAQGAVEAVQRAKKINATKTSEMTDGAVAACTQRDKLLAHILAEYGVKLPDMKADTVRRRIEDERLPDSVRELLALRLDAASTGDSKYRALLRSVSSDGRLRGTTLLAGARRTGRWAGRHFQPHNLIKIPKWVKPIYDEAVEAVTAGVVDLLYDDPLKLIPKLARACVIAPPQKRLDISDLANIEGRVLAWLAGEEWKLKAFCDFDAGKGEDLYVLGYSRAFHTPIEDIHEDMAAGGRMRDTGKTQELALGYGGAVGAFTAMAEKYGLSFEEDFIIKSVKAWRKANAKIVKFWYALEKKMKLAIAHPGKVYVCRKLSIRRDKAWLRIKLPSGRYLCYPSPRVDGEGISCMGVDPYSRKWSRIYIWGGGTAGCVTQAVARDIIGIRMLAVEKEGYATVLHVHDELITEVIDDDTHSHERLSEILVQPIDWAEGLPLAASGFSTKRYRKG